MPGLRRNRELTRLYVALGLAVLVWMIFKVYKLVSEQVGGGVDAPSRWALLALGLVNVLAIGSLLFIVARSLAKVYFERRSGILGSRIRTRLVLALFGIAIVPSLMLYLVGRDFISKNVERWFKPEVQEVITAGGAVGAGYWDQVRARLEAADARPFDDLDADRALLGLDLAARIQGGKVALSVAPGLKAPEGLGDLGLEATVDLPEGRWKLHGSGGQVAGLFVPRALVEQIATLETRAREAAQVKTFRDPITTLPQNTFLFLTLLTLFAAVWVGLTLSRTISEPVRALARGAQRVGAGDLDVKLSEEGEDELAFLSRTFNRMTSDLRENRATLEAQAQRIEVQRAYLNQLLEALPVGVLSWAPDGALRVLNPTAQGWFGLAGTAPADWSAMMDQPRFGRLPALRAAARETHRLQLEEFRVGSESEGRPVRAVVAPLSDGGCLAVVEDLSQLAHAEKRAAWQEVARRMAHEVKNPLTPIQLTAQRLLRRARENRLEPQVVQDGAEAILLEVASLARLVESFSRFARLPQPVPAPLDVADLVRQVAALYGPTHPAIAWEVGLPEGQLRAVWDRDMVKRALINLVDNALAALGDAGTVRLKAEGRGGEILLSVEDDGPGIPETHRERLFEPSFSTKERGSGLGLAIVRRIAEDHGGEARFEPLTPGCRFTLRLPMGHAGV